MNNKKNQYLYNLKALLALFVASGWLFSSAALAQDIAPCVYFDYGFVPFDRACESLKGSEIDKAMVEEMSQRVGEFQEHWDVYGTPMIEMIIKEVGKPFRYRDIIATMSVCDFYSMSHPLILNMRRFLKNGPEAQPHSKQRFLALVVHELLHIYISNIGLEGLPMAEKYKDEPFSVRSHVYLMALMKMMYLKSGQVNAYQDMLDLEKEKNRPIYLRSWEIVNELEDYQAFVKELREK